MEKPHPRRNLAEWERCSVPGCGEEALFFEPQQLCPVHEERRRRGRPLEEQPDCIYARVLEAGLATLAASSLDDGQDFLERRARVEPLLVEYAATRVRTPGATSTGGTRTTK